MTKLVLAVAIIVVAAVAANGCVTQSDPSRAALETESVATSELTAAGDATVQPRICFTCDIDPSVHSCSSIASHAQHVCQRACVVCDDFGDNIGDCFSGLCEPDLP